MLTWLVALGFFLHGGRSLKEGYTIEYVTPENVDGTEDAVEVPLIQFAMADLELYEDEAALFQSYYDNYMPFWPEDKVGLFPIALSYAILVELEGKNYGEETLRVLELLDRVYRDGHFGELNLFKGLMTQEQLYSSLPDALDFFIPILKNFAPESIEMRVAVAELYAESNFLQARQRLYKFYEKDSEEFIRRNLDVLTDRGLAKALHFLGNVIWYVDGAGEINKSGKSKSLSRQIYGTKYLKSGYQLFKKNAEYESSYRLALSHVVLETIRHNLNELYKRNKEKFKLWTGNIKKTFTSVDIVPYDRLSYEHFFREYALKRKPVVIKGLANVMARGKTFNLQYLKSACSSMKVKKKSHKADDVQNWAGLIEFGDTTVGKFVDDIAQNITYNAENGSVPYIFDEGLADYPGCPQLLKDLTIPKYFTQDIGRMMENHRYKTHPSLFVGPKDSSCGLHVDSSSSNFWQALFTGKKKWYFYPFEDGDAQILLHDSPFFSSFRVDPHSAPPEDQPLFKFAQENRVEVVVEPGDIIFVPSDTPHAVRNLEDIFAISHNYYDGSNLLRFARTMMMEDDTSESMDFDEILGSDDMQIEKLKRIVRKDPKDLTYEEWNILSLKNYFNGAKSADDDPWVDKASSLGGNKTRFLTYEWPSISSSTADLVQPICGRKSFLEEEHIAPYFDGDMLEAKLAINARDDLFQKDGTVGMK